MNLPPPVAVRGTETPLRMAPNEQEIDMTRTLIAVKRSVVEAAMELAEIDLDYLRTDYSGRGMYGETCWGIYLDTVSELAQFMVAVTVTLAESAVDDDDVYLHDAIEPATVMAVKLRTDSMGQGLIAYWPGVKLEA